MDNAEEEDLDGILDDALAEFDDVPASYSTAQKGNSIPRDSSVRARNQDGGSSSLDGASSTEKPCDSPDPTVTAQASAEKLQGWDDGLDAFERAIASLDHLTPNVDDAEDGSGAASESEDLKLVEDFLQSLSSEFEKLGVPPPSEEALEAAAAGTGSTGAGGSRPVEDEIDKLTQELESILGGAASKDVGTEQRGLPSDAGSSGFSPDDGDAPSSEGGGNFERIVESVVGELLSKDVLKVPMEQMRDSYASWLPLNIGKLSDSDATRYRKQEQIVGRICAEYARSEWKTTKVMTLLQEMQATGAPPPEVMTQLGADGGDDGGGAELEKLRNCPLQ